jgi:hypothetical protein
MIESRTSPTIPNPTILVHLSPRASVKVLHAMGEGLLQCFLNAAPSKAKSDTKFADVGFSEKLLATQSRLWTLIIA